MNNAITTGNILFLITTLKTCINVIKMLMLIIANKILADRLKYL